MRYLPLTDADRASMLAAIGVGSVDAFYDGGAGEAGGAGGAIIDLPCHRSEHEVTSYMERLAARNRDAGQGPFFLGGGAYRHHIPASVDHIVQRSEFLTSYTPYQPEIAQGTLQSLFEFQTQTARLTGMEIANASMYDGASACAEAALMACRITRRNRIILASGLHPHYAAATRLLCETSGIEVRDMAENAVSLGQNTLPLDDGTACVIAQNPNVFGAVYDLAPLADQARQYGALFIAVVTEAVSLGLLRPPGEKGADIVVAEGQSIGNSLNFGGPHLGLFACRKQHVRHMPGRVVGQTTDMDGRPSFCLTLNAREQHIRRQNATSNICTNSGLCALAFSAHLTLLGGVGLRTLAERNHERARRLADRLAALDGVEILTSVFFNEFSYRTPMRASHLIDRLLEKGVLGGVAVSRLFPRSGMDDIVVTAASECSSDEDIEAYGAALAESLR